MKIQLIKKIELSGEEWWKVFVDEEIIGAYCTEDMGTRMYETVKENIKKKYPIEEVLKEEII